MTRIDFMNLFSPVVYSVIKDGHNYVNAPEADLKLYTDRGGKLFPFPVTIRDRKLFINSILLDIPYNSIILSINEKSSREIVDQILSGYNAESEYFEEAINSEWFNGSYWYSYGGYKEYKIEYISSLNNSKNLISIIGKTQPEIDSLRSSKIIKSYSFSEVQELKTGLISYNVCDDLEHFRPFCDSVFQILKDKKYENLIIDVRRNIGGTTRLNDVFFEYLTNKPIAEFEKIETKISKDKKKDFIYWNNHYAGWFKWYHYLYYPIYIRLNSSRKENLTARNGTTITQNFIPKSPTDNKLRFSGKLYLLTSKLTYSAAACFSAAFKCFNLGTVIGQETGETTHFFANWAGVTLPNTKLVCAISAAHFVLSCDKKNGKGVIPDFIIEVDHASSLIQDKELEFTKQLIKEN